MRFANRQDAGRKLTPYLRGYQTDRMIILALPRGGVPVGYEIARALHVPLDILIVRKLGTPGQPELAMGAIGPNNVVVLNEEVISLLQIHQNAIDQVIATESIELQRRMQAFRGDRPFPDLHDKTVVIVDDGLATGSTALAAIQAVRLMEPAQVILAVPVCAPQSAQRLRPQVDDLVCLEQPADFAAVGYWYQDFRQTRDQEVIELLHQAWQAEPLPTSSRD